jgi:putative hemolysin
VGVPLQLLALAVLLAISAAFSAAETALFSLTSSDERRAGATAKRLLADPPSLLVSILIGNLVSNTLFFAFAASLLARREAVEQWIGNLLALGAIVVAGEILPKTLALRARILIARWAAVPMAAWVAATRPLQRLATKALELIYRALGPAAFEEVGITSDALGHALERSAEQGLLLESEASILSGIVELEDVRVREIMTPRVDMLFLDISAEGRDEIVARAVAAKAPWVIVIDGNPDRILGRVRTRVLLAEPSRPLREALEPCRFVPEVATALHALHFLRENKVAQAVAIDEWGGTAGIVTVESIFEEVVGDLRVEGETAIRPVVALGQGRFEVDGSISIRDWNEQFGARVVPREFETLGGFVAALLRRIPRSGDTVRSGPLVFEVGEVRRRRIVRLVVHVAEAEEARA